MKGLAEMESMCKQVTPNNAGWMAQALGARDDGRQEGVE